MAKKLKDAGDAETAMADSNDIGQKGVNPPLPVLLEMAFSLPVFIVIVMDIVVAALSYLAGAGVVYIFLRVVVTTVGLGALLWLVAYQFSSVLKQPAQANSNQRESSLGQQPARSK